MTTSRYIAVAIVMVAAGCSSGSGGLPVEISTVSDSDSPEMSFTASGEAVDQGVLCASGTGEWTGNRTIDGDPLSDEAMAELFDGGEVYTIIVGHEYVCADGSGTFVVDTYPEIDPSLDQDVPVTSVDWEITGGTGDYASLTGSGETPDDVEPARFEEVLVGTVSAG